MQRLLLALTLVTLVACGSGDTAPPPLGTDEIAARASAAMTSIESASFVIEVRGAPVEIEGLEFSEAKGDYSAPDSAVTALKMRVGTATIEMAAISIGDRTWLTDPLTGAWNEVPQGLGFNPAIVFGSEGWGSILAEDLSGGAVGDRDGNYLLIGSVPPERVDLLTAGIVADQEVEIELTIDSRTFRVLAAVFSTESGEGTTDWSIELGGFDRAVTIEAPTTG